MTHGAVSSPSLRRADRIADRLVDRLGETVELADVEIDPAHLVLGDAWRSARLRSRCTPALPTRPRPGSMMVSGMRVAEMLAQRAEDRLAVGLQLSDVLRRYFAGKPPPRLTIDSVMPRSAQLAEDGRRRGERPVPGLDVALLRADVERDAVGHQAALVRVLQDVDGHRPARSRTCARAAIRRRRRRSGCGRSRGAGRGARTFSTSASQSTANRRTPSSKARGDCRAPS